MWRSSASSSWREWLEPSPGRLERRVSAAVTDGNAPLAPEGGCLFFSKMLRRQTA
jgi:hypothetical protein